MREIKFRAWDGKKLYYWDSIEHPKTGEITGTQYPKLFYLPMSHLCGDSNDWEWTQYTGLKDKNGKEIYETDRVKCINKYDEEFILEVRWIPNLAAFYYVDDTCKEGEWISQIGMFDNGEEVVGNAYEGDI